MKHLLKPLGHCLTTAVVTSAMLRVYSLPAVEAATPDTTAPQPTEGAAALGGAALSTSDPGPAPIAPPEAIAPIETAAPTATVAPEVPASPALSESAAPEQTSAVPEVAPTPQAVESAPAQVTAPALSEPEAVETNPAASPADPASLDQAQPASASKQKAQASAQNIAGMRQILEKRLATIVEQDKATRNAQWQQNLINSAVQYAWLGEFERARQIAMHPGLPLDVQTELLGKITALEQAFQIAQQPNQPGVQAHPTLAPGRSVPSGYPIVNMPAIASGYAGAVVNQCPAPAQSAARPAVAKTSPAPQPSKPTSAKAGIPAFVPALGQNLAARLAQLNRTSVARAASTQASSLHRQPLVSPQLFAGVASDSLLQSKQQVAKPVSQAQSTTQTPRQPASVAQASVTQPSATPTTSQKTIAQSVVQPTITHPSVIRPQRLQSKPISTASTSLPAVSAMANSTVKAPANLSFDQIVGSTLNFSFRQLGIPISQLISDPLDLAWAWWATPDNGTATVPAPAQLPVANAAVYTTASTAASAIVAETGLNAPLLQAVEQDLASMLQSPRDGRKLSIPNLLVSKAASKAIAAAKTAVYDPSALIAMGCAGAQLAHYESGGYVIDPATSKKLGWVNLMFPLPIPSVITSAFGWRIHPISGSLSFHSGLDIGAPMGTPVLAALSGRVVAADYMGGYGLAVVVENGTKHQRNLYGHLSAIAVQPGVQVKQGAVVGWVGSTGNSTGPHLHFESQVQTQAGWTAIDPLASAAVSIAQGK